MMDEIIAGDIVVGIVQRSVFKWMSLDCIIPNRPSGGCSIRVDELALVVATFEVRQDWRKFKALEIVLPDGVIGWIDDKWVRSLRE